MTNKRKSYAIFNLQIARMLIEEGYHYIGKEINKQNPLYYVYYFETVEGLDKKVKELAELRKKQLL